MQVLRRSSLLLILIFIGASFARLVASFFILHPPIPTDELAYKNMALSFFSTFDFYHTRNMGYFVDIPNVFYPWLASSAFILGDNFYYGIKVINSLVVCSVVFPTYLLARQITDVRSSIIAAAAVVSLPALGSSYFVMAEAVTYPLTVFAVYLAVRAFAESDDISAIGLGFVAALLILNKPVGLALAVAMCLAVILLMLASTFGVFGVSRRLLIRSFFVFAFTTPVFLLLLKYILTGDAVYRLGMYGQFATLRDIDIAPFSETVKMALAHISTIALGYFFPLIFLVRLAYSATMTSGCETRKSNEVAFALITLSCFIVYLSLCLKFTISIYDGERFSRLHARYYNALFPLFIVGYTATYRRFVFSALSRLALGAVFLFVIAVNLTFVIPTYVSLGLTIVDNPDFSWVFGRLSVYVFILLSLISLFVFVVFTERRRLLLVSVVTVFIWGSIQHTALTAHYSEMLSGRAEYVNSVLKTYIPDTNASVVIIDSSLVNRLSVAFWNQYIIKRVYDLPNGATVSAEFIPTNTDYLIVFGEYEFAFESNVEFSNKGMSIIKLP